MVVFCVETKQDKVVKDFVKETHKRLSQGVFGSFMFKGSSFAYTIKERNKYIIILNVETMLLGIPKIILYPIMRKGLKKRGYKGEVKLVNNNLIFLKLAKVIKNLPRRNNPMA